MMVVMVLATYLLLIGNGDYDDDDIDDGVDDDVKVGVRRDGGGER